MSWQSMALALHGSYSLQDAAIDAVWPDVQQESVVNG